MAQEQLNDQAQKRKTFLQIAQVGSSNLGSLGLHFFSRHCSTLDHSAITPNIVKRDLPKARAQEKENFLTLKVFDQAVLFGHPLSSETETHGDCRQKTLRHVGDRHADEEHDGVDQIVPDGQRYNEEGATCEYETKLLC